MATNQTFGQRIRELRKAKNLTQRELAERVASRLKEEDRRGFDVTYLSKIENDKMPPPSTIAIMQLAKNSTLTVMSCWPWLAKPPWIWGRHSRKAEQRACFTGRRKS